MARSTCIVPHEQSISNQDHGSSFWSIPPTIKNVPHSIPHAESNHDWSTLADSSSSTTDDTHHESSVEDVTSSQSTIDAPTTNSTIPSRSKATTRHDGSLITTVSLTNPKNWDHRTTSTSKTNPKYEEKNKKFGCCTGSLNTSGNSWRPSLSHTS